MRARIVKASLCGCRRARGCGCALSGPDGGQPQSGLRPAHAAIMRFSARSETRSRDQRKRAPPGGPKRASRLARGLSPAPRQMLHENRGTTTTVGLLFPQSTLFSMTGPVLGTRTRYDSVWGCQRGAVLLSCGTAVDFGNERAVRGWRAGTDLLRTTSSPTRSRFARLPRCVPSTSPYWRRTSPFVAGSRRNVDRLQISSE